MAGPEDDSDKTHEPTPKKLADARKRGEIPRSNDLHAAAGTLGFLVALYALGQEGARGVSDVLAGLIGRVDLHAMSLQGAGGPWLMGALLRDLGLPLAILFGMPAAGVMLSIAAQRALVFAPEKLQPKGNRISPLSGLKNKFGPNGLFEFGKSAVKMTAVSILVWAFVASRLDRLIATSAMSPGQLTNGLGILIQEMLLLVLALLVTIGGIDYLWQLAEHYRKNRMSHKELKDEVKDSEGDPHFKQERRQRGYEIATQRMLQDVPGADVVIVNPTHFAVALKWDRASGVAPVCVAKGVDEIAARIREIASEAEVPVYSDPPTARAIHATVEIGHQIDREHYRAVAAAIRFAEDIRARAAKRGR